MGNRWRIPRGWDAATAPLVALLVMVFLGGPGAAVAQDEGAAMDDALAEAKAQVESEDDEDRPISNVTELALVQTTGNSENFTFSFQNTFVRNWKRSSVTIGALVLRSESTDRILVNDGGVVVETSEEEVTADHYGLSLRYDRDISERTGWFGLGSWERNRPAGIENRSNGGAGISYTFFDTDVHKLTGQAGFGYTVEEPVGGERDDYPVARLFSRYWRSISDTSSFDLQVEGIENLDETDDYRVNFLGGVTAKLTDKLALRVSYTLYYDNEPVLLIIPGDDPGEADGVFAFDKTDTILAASLVIDL
jgi:hypothetical protein